MPNSYKLNQGYNRQQQNKNGAFFAKRQDKVLKDMQKNDPVVDEVQAMLQLVLQYQLFDNNTVCGVTGTYQALQGMDSLPGLATGDKVGCSKVEYHSGNSTHTPDVEDSLQYFRTFCRGNNTEINNALPERTRKFLARELGKEFPGLSADLLDFAKFPLPTVCEGTITQNFTNRNLPSPGDRGQGISNGAVFGIGSAVGFAGPLALLLGCILTIWCIKNKCKSKDAGISRPTELTNTGKKPTVMLVTGVPPVRERQDDEGIDLEQGYQQQPPMMQ